MVDHLEPIFCMINNPDIFNNLPSLKLIILSDDDGCLEFMLEKITFTIYYYLLAMIPHIFIYNEFYSQGY